MARKLNVPVQEAIEQILRLRALERNAPPNVRREIVGVRDFLEDLVGPTVSVSDAARALKVSRPAVVRWIEKGDLSAVVTPAGRREVPLGELVELCLSVADANDDSPRPIARVMRDRERAAQEDVDIDRLLPRRGDRGHRTAELQSLAYHRLVSERIDEATVDRAQQRLERWVRAGRIHPRWASEWRRVLALPVERIARTISADTPRARELRQTSPFAGLLTPQERRRLRGAVEARAAR